MISEATKVITSIMKLKKVNKSELASRMGTSRSNITQLLDGKRNMTLSTLEKIMKALDVDFHLVWFEKGED